MQIWSIHPYMNLQRFTDLEFHTLPKKGNSKILCTNCLFESIGIVFVMLLDMIFETSWDESLLESGWVCHLPNTTRFNSSSFVWAQHLNIIIIIIIIIIMAVILILLGVFGDPDYSNLRVFIRILSKVTFKKWCGMTMLSGYELCIIVVLLRFLFGSWASPCLPFPGTAKV